MLLRNASLRINLTEFKLIESQGLHRAMFSYSLQPNQSLCEAKQPLMIYVKSAVNESEARQAIRETWGVVAQEIGVPVTFCIGLPRKLTESFLRKLTLEQMQHGDLLQGDFLDTYHTLSLKTLATLHWHVNHCSDNASHFFFFTDSDVIVFPEILLLLVKSKLPSQKTITGHCWFGAPVNRDKQQKKYFVSDQLWPARDYPHYCSGTGFLLSPLAPESLIKAIPAKSASAKRAWVGSFQNLDDILFTGILCSGAGINIEHSHMVHFGPIPIPTHKQCDRHFISAHNYKPPEHMRQVWLKMREQMNC